MIRRTLFSLLFALLALALPASAQETTRITFLHTNDNYELLPQRGWGGFAELMTALRAERSAAPHTITTFGGDLLSPSLMSGFYKGRHMIELMNAVGADIAVPGNHEFDFGPDVLVERIRESKFPWLASNVRRDGQPLKGAPDTVIRTVAGIKIGFFGLVTPDTAKLSSPGPRVTFEAPVAAAEAMVKRLKDEGADIVVALTHLDFADDREVARKVPGIALILGGHDHEPITLLEGSTLILKSGADAHYLGVVSLDVTRRPDGANPVGTPGNVASVPALEVVASWRTVPIHNLAPDAQRSADIRLYTDMLAQELKIEIATLAAPLDSRRLVVREEEAAIGDLFAEAIRETVGAEVALLNGGGFRGDRVYPAGTRLTRRDVLGELPFGNTTVVLDIKGADLLEALEHGVSRAGSRDGRFPQVAGLRFAYDPRLPPMKRVSDVTVAGQKLDPARSYRLATIDFLLNGGDGYKVLAKATPLIVDGQLMALQVMQWIEARKTIDIKPDGRISKK